MTRLLMLCCVATATALFITTAPARAYEVFAASFFPPEAGDPDPAEMGVLKINVTTGAVSTFIPLNPSTGLLFPTDLAVSAASNTLYVSTQLGAIWHFNASSGAPLPSLVPGRPAGTFAVLPGAAFGDAVTSLLVRRNGSLVATTAFGSVTPFDSTTGAAGTDLATGLAFPSGAAESLSSSTLYVSVGDPFGGPGSFVSIQSSGVLETLVPYGAGLRGAGGPTVVAPLGDYSSSGRIDANDLRVWDLVYGSNFAFADGNGDGVVDAADYTIARDNLGATQEVLIADLNSNRLALYDGADTNTASTFAVIPPVIPTPLPPTANPDAPSNSPSDILPTPQGTLLVSTLGLTRRPDNRGALLEYSRDGTLLRTIATGLSPLSAIELVPTGAPALAIPEPSGLLLACLAAATLVRRPLPRRNR